jgi:hypothetical protein
MNLLFRHQTIISRLVLCNLWIYFVDTNLVYYDLSFAAYMHLLCGHQTSLARLVRCDLWTFSEDTRLVYHD